MWMLEGRDRGLWDHTSMLMWSIFSASPQCNPKKMPSPEKFHPYHTAKRKRKSLDFEHLKQQWQAAGLPVMSPTNAETKVGG